MKYKTTKNFTFAIPRKEFLVLELNALTDRNTDRQTNKKTDRKTDIWANRRTNRFTDRHDSAYLSRKAQ